MKYAAYNVDDASHANPADIVETGATQGQGDTHQIVHTAVLEALVVETKSAETVRKEKENEATGEATKVSVGLLHQLIEELENKPISAKNSENIASTSLTSKENIAAWEEKEEQFIRTIENTGSLPETTTDTLRASESAGCFRNVALQPYEEPSGELKSRSSQHVASTSRESCLEEMQIQRYDSSPLSSSMLRRDNAAMEEILTMNEIETRKASGEATMTTTTKKRKKKGLGGRLRKFFRAVFARKNWSGRDPSGETSPRDLTRNVVSSGSPFARSRSCVFARETRRSFAN